MLFVAPPSSLQHFQPESFEENMYDITYLGDSLRYLVKNIKINVYQGNININLIDYFPLLKEGYNYRDTIDLILIAFALSQHKNPSDISIFNEAFGDEIPITYYNKNRGFIFNPISIDQLQNYQLGKITPTFSRFPIAEAIERNIVPSYINTYQYFELINGNFDPKNFHIDTIEQLTFENLISKYDMPELSSYIKISGVMEGLIKESKLANNICSIIESNPNLTDDISLIDIVNIALDHTGVGLLEKISQDTRIKLYYAIIINDLYLVNQYLNEIDPRNNRGEAYKLARKIGNQSIIDSIHDNIIKRNWHEEQALTKIIQPLIGLSDLPNTIYRYINKRENYYI